MHVRFENLQKDADVFVAQPPMRTSEHFDDGHQHVRDLIMVQCKIGQGVGLLWQLALKTSLIDDFLTLKALALISPLGGACLSTL